MKVTVYFKHCKQLLVCKGGQIGGATLMPPPSSMNAQEIQSFPINSIAMEVALKVPKLSN